MRRSIPVSAAAGPPVATPAVIRPTTESFRSVLHRASWLRLAIGYALAFGTGAALAFALHALGWWPGAAWERQVLIAVHATVNPVLDLLMLTLPYFGTNYTLAPLVAIAAVLLWRRGYAAVALHLAVVQLGSWTLNPLLKFTFPRPRPTLFEQRGQHAFPAFPSGHSIAVTTVLFTAAWLVHRTGHGRWGYTVFALYFVLNSFSRVYLSVHWPSDVIAGTLVGVVWLVATMIVFGKVYAFRGGGTGLRARDGDVQGS